MAKPITGHDGPFDAPVRIRGGEVIPAWVDYNGHMNVAYYTLAMDAALDQFLEDELGLGATQALEGRMGPYSLQSNYRYLYEMRLGETYDVDVMLLDHDAKRVHLFLSLIRRSDKVCAATVETLLMNVDLEGRRSTDYPDWAVARLGALQAAHDALPRPDGIAAPVGIRRQ